MNRVEPFFTLVVAIGSVLLLVCGGADAQLVPRPPSPHLQRPLSRVLLDMDGNGIDLSGCSSSTGHRGPKVGSDDRLLAIDVAEAGRAGYRVVSTEGARGPVMMLGSGLRVTLPTGAIHEPVDGWSAIALLDSSRDGVLGPSDLCWSALRFAHDSNGDGVIQSDEVELPSSQNVVAVGPRSPAAPQRDALANGIAEGTFARRDRTIGRMADVSLASCDAPKDAKDAKDAGR